MQELARAFGRHASISELWCSVENYDIRRERGKNGYKHFYLAHALSMVLALLSLRISADRTLHFFYAYAQRTGNYWTKIPAICLPTIISSLRVPLMAISVKRQMGMRAYCRFCGHSLVIITGCILFLDFSSYLWANGTPTSTVNCCPENQATVKTTWHNFVRMVIVAELKTRTTKQFMQLLDLPNLVSGSSTKMLGFGIIFKCVRVV